MDDLGAWLRAMGLEQYTERFEANGVDRRTLAHLNDADLASLGVLLGHRRLLRAALAETPAPGPPGEAEAEAGERRLLTVLFADVVGSSRLAETLDVEDYRELIAAFRGAVEAAVEPFAGYVAKYLGDGVLVYFGYPRAYGDDAARAVRAGAALIEAVGRLAPSASNRLAVRVGIATGEVVVGDLVGAGMARERGVLGVAPNVAARLQALAGPAEVILGDATRRALPAGIGLDDLGRVELKGIAEPVRAWRLAGLDAVADAAPPTPFVGRGDVLARLEACWAEVGRGGRAAVLHLTGEPGIGKTRLLDTFRRGLAPAACTRWVCSAFERNRPLHPLPASERTGAAAVEGEGEAGRRAALAAVVADLDARLDAAPLLLLVDDAHWIDPTTAELLEEVVRRLARRPLLVIVAARPGTRADDLVDRLGSSRLELAPLPPADAEALVAAAAPTELTAAARAEVVARAGGLPLFLEELLRVVAADGDVTVPLTLEQSLLARLDALGRAKAVAQIAAVLGTSCRRDELAALAGLDDAALGFALERLSSEGLLVATATGFAFRHALIRDVAYETLLKRERRRLHGKVADRLVAAGADAAPEVTARHLRAAERRAEAVPYWFEAGRRSAAQWAHAEAATYFETALGHPPALGDARVELRLRLALAESLRLLERCEDGLAEVDRAAPLAERLADDGARLQLQVLRGNLSFPLGDIPACIAAHESALAIARGLADPAAEARALSGIGDGHFAGRRLLSAERAYDRCVALAEAHGLDDIVLANLSLRGHMRIYQCRLDDARRDCERALAMAVARGDRRAELVARGSCLGRVHLEAGEFSAASRAFAGTARQAGELGASRYEALNLVFEALAALDAGDRAHGAATAARVIALERRAGRRYCLPIALAVAARADPSGACAPALLAEGEALLAGPCLAHNHFWFYRNAVLTAAARGLAGELRRYRTGLVASFAGEPPALIDQVATGAAALADVVDGADAAALDDALAAARAAGLNGWARVLAGAAARV